MGFKPTKEQETVIKDRGNDLLVSAAAGSGKTAVLVERIIGLICDDVNPVDIDRFLVVTFTKAAASEMKEKILNAIYKRLETDPDNERLRLQSKLVNYADICTIDSFCNRVVKDNFTSLNLSVGFQTMSEDDAKSLNEKVIDEVFLDYFKREDEDFIKLCDVFVYRNSINRLKRMILTLYEQAMSFPYPEEWIRSLIEPFSYKTIKEVKAADWYFRIKEIIDSEQITDKKTLDKLPVGEIKDYLYQIGKMKPLVEKLIEVTLDFMTVLICKKEAENSFTFNDIEHFALELLRDIDGEPTHIADDLRNHYAYVFVDEYQDSNMLQESILTSIVKRDENRNYFMVGDVKQSIYRFRKAKPSIFTERYNAYKHGEDSSKVVELSKNFRSRSDVVDFVNDVFEMIMKKEIGGVEYDEKAKLVFGAEQEYKRESGYTPELYLTPSDSGFIKNDSKDKDRIEARLVAKCIKNVVKNLKITKEKRRVLYSDIAILHRSAKAVSDVYLEVLKEEGIPVMAMATKDFFLNYEVEVVLSMLSVISNPYDDIALTGVLTNLYGFSNDDLAKVRTKEEYNKLSFSKAFFEYAKKFGGKAGDFANELENLREEAKDTKLHEIIQTVFNINDFKDKLSALPAGEAKLSNLEKLFSYSVEFEKNGDGSLIGFLNRIKLLKEYNLDMDANTAIEENSVRLYTIHKSKGLEAPVCILAGMGSKLNKTVSENGIVVSDMYGVGFDFIDRELAVKVPTLHKSVLEFFEKTELTAEYLRLLYVALTRAQEKLIMTGVMKTDKLEKILEKVKDGNINYQYIIKADNFFSLVIPAVAKGHCKFRILNKDNYLDFFENKKEFDEDENKKIILDMSLNPQNEDKELIKKIDFTYPVKAGMKLKSKYSVSEIKRRDSEDEEAENLYVTSNKFQRRIPAFLSTKNNDSVSASIRGTAVHRFMECLEFKGDIRLNDELSRMTKENLLTKEEANLINLDQIEVFLKSNLAKRMIKAESLEKLFKEKTFVCSVKSSDLFSDEEFCEIEKDDETLIQGIIDAYFEEDGEIVLLDYKTDKVNNEEELKDRYKTQLSMYADALGRAKDTIIRQKLIYSFELGQEIEI